WSQMSSAGVSFNFGRGSFVDGFLQVLAHAGASGVFSFLGLTFDPSTDTWGSYPEPDADASRHFGLALCSDGDSLYLFGGQAWQTAVRTSASYAYRVVDTDPDPEPIPGTATAPLNVSIGVTGRTSRAPAFVNVGVAGKTSTAPMDVDVTVIDVGVGHAPLYIDIGVRKFVRVPMNVQVEVHSGGVWTAPLHANIGVTRSSTGPMLIEAATRKKSTAPMSVLYHVTGKRVTAPMLVVNGVFFLWVPDMSQVHEEIHFN